MKVLLIVLIAVLLFTTTLLSLELSYLFSEPIYLEVSSEDVLKQDQKYIFEEELSDLDLQFYPNMRFSYNEISYFIDESCDNEKSDRIKEALEHLEQEIGNINFYESSHEPNIKAKCNETLMRDYEDMGGKKHFILGEGEPTSIIQTGLFYVIEGGVIFLFYDEPMCGFPIVELHELLHAFGFQHTSDKKSIMYPIASCDQELTNEIKNEMKRLYSIESLPDLKFMNLSVVKQGNSLNFHVKIINQGLVDAEEVELFVYAYPSGEKIERFDLETLEYGSGKSLKVEMRLPFRTNRIKFEISAGEELNYDNNIVEIDFDE
jgi:hypothetical protein